MTLLSTDQLEQAAQPAQQQLKTAFFGNNKKKKRHLSADERRSRWKDSRWSDSLEIVGLAAIFTFLLFLASEDAANPLVTSNNLQLAHLLKNICHPLATGSILMGLFMVMRYRQDVMVLLLQLAVSSLVAYGLDQLWFVARVGG